jgi:general secretion pathway protein I
MKAGERKDQAGFSLLELLVAFAIMAMSLGLIYRAMGASARNAGDLELHQQASMLAESLLNSKDSVTDQGWNESGVFNSFNWRVSSGPYRAAPAAPDLVLLHEIRISISWPGGATSNQLEVQTLLPQRKPVPGETVQ